MKLRLSELAHSLAGPKNPLYALHERLQAEGRPVVDLVRGNVNEHGIVFPQDLLDEIHARAAAAARIYRPDSLGQAQARQAVASYYGDLNISPDRILLTPGTSISYWYAFKLLAETGDEILCPRPSYPLFDYIARLCGVQLTHYRLLEPQGWAIDLDYLENHVSTKTRAIVVISPHNPTGMVADQGQLNALAEIAIRHGLAIISDEVFNEFLFGIESLPRAAATNAPLVLTLNGFSKMFALPGMKIGWMAVTGSEPEVTAAMSALAMISDTFLPVNEVGQFAVPSILQQGREFLREYTNWVKRCREVALEGLSGVPFTAPRGGFYMTIPIGGGEDAVAAALLEQDGILAHPGYFYDIDPDHLVMTFVHDPASIGGYFELIRKRLRREPGTGA